MATTTTAATPPPTTPPPVSLAHRLASREDQRLVLHREAAERLRRKAS
ncbi:hypothetical protein [Actinoplanes sp. NPDC049599]